MRRLAFVFACTLLLPTLDAGAQDEEALVLVYEDVNQNQTFDEADESMDGVRVSSMAEVRTTDENGQVRMPLDAPGILFVVRPSGYQFPLQKNGVPDFYHLHYPEGTPSEQLKYPGVSPTGPLPDTLFFPLHPTGEEGPVTANVVGDPQIPRPAENKAFRLETIPELMETNADFSLFLGDIADDDLSIFPHFEGSVQVLDQPVYPAFGNHDVNFRASGNARRAETYRAHFGPDYYSFNYGDAHFAVLNSVDYEGWNEEEGTRGNYFGGIDEQQMEWVRQDIEQVEPGRPIYLVTHIPIHDRFFAPESAKTLLEVVEDREAVTILSGHLHGFMSWTYDGDVFGMERASVRGYSLGATAGSWWAGPYAPDSIPDATMTDGMPNGFFAFAFDSTGYEHEFVPVGEPKDHQLRISTPHNTVRRDSLGRGRIVVNVFAGDERFRVAARIDDRVPVDTLEQFTGYDPFVLRTNDRRVNRDDWRPNPAETGHLWRGRLQPDLSLGTHVIEATVTFPDGKEYIARKVFEVVE